MLYAMELTPMDVADFYREVPVCLCAQQLHHMKLLSHSLSLSLPPPEFDLRLSVVSLVVSLFYSLVSSIVPLRICLYMECM